MRTGTRIWRELYAVRHKHEQQDWSSLSCQSLMFRCHKLNSLTVVFRTSWRQTSQPFNTLRRCGAESFYFFISSKVIGSRTVRFWRKSRNLFKSQTEGSIEQNVRVSVSHLTLQLLFLFPPMSSSSPSIKKVCDAYSTIITNR